MAAFNISVVHQQNQASVSEKLRNFADVVLSDLPAGVTDVTQQWDRDGNLQFALKAMGMQLNGTMEVKSEQVVIVGTMPFAALPFRGAIESQIRERVAKALA